MPVAVDPTYPSISTVAVRKQADYLEISFKPDTGTAVVWERIPMLSEFGAYAPSTQDAELPLFIDANGQSVTLKSSLENGGAIDFSVAAHASDPVYKKLISAAKKGTPVVYRARYASMEITIQGQGSIKDRGMQGDANAIPQWAFTLNTFTAQYVDNVNNVIA